MSHSRPGIHDVSVFFIEDIIMNSNIFEHRFGNGQSFHYRRLPSGTCYHADTPVPVIELLEQLRKSRRKIRLFYGDPATGQSWHEEHDVIGCIGRSTGAIKVPLLIESGEIGGPALLDHCIIRIDTPRKVLYQHATFRVGDVTLVQGVLQDVPWEVWIDNVVHARFQSKAEARHYSDFMQGHRFARR
jgi:hypothetical protein